MRMQELKELADNAGEANHLSINVDHIEVVNVGTTVFWKDDRTDGVIAWFSEGGDEFTKIADLLSETLNQVHEARGYARAIVND